jgi:hypothetical protein
MSQRIDDITSFQRTILIKMAMAKDPRRAAFSGPFLSVVGSIAGTGGRLKKIAEAKKF